MDVPDKWITELSELLRKNSKETQVSLAIGSGSYRKNGKLVNYVIDIAIREIDDFEDAGVADG